MRDGGSRDFTKIACFHQNDDYGQAGLKGSEAALKKRSLELVATGNYERNTTAVKTGLLDIKKGEPQAIVMVGTYKACAEFIKLAKKVGLGDAVFCNISFVGTKALLAELGGEGNGVVISQVVPLPSNTMVPVVREFQQAWKAVGATLEPSHLALEGYINARVFAEALRRAGSSPTRNSFIDNAWNLKRYDLGGFEVSFTESDKNASRFVELTMVSRDGRFIR